MTALTRLVSLRRIIVFSVFCPYILSGVFGTIVYVTLNITDGIPLAKWSITEILLFLSIASYISFGGFVGTFPVAITAFLNKYIKDTTKDN